MNIAEIDPNLNVETGIRRDGLVWFDVRKAPFCIYGLCEAKDGTLPFHRIPTSVAEATSNGVRNLNFCTAGGRLRFSTNSPYIALKCETYGTLRLMNHMPLTGTQGFDLYRDDTHGSHYVRSFIPPLDLSLSAFDTVIDLDTAGLHHYTVNFPLYGTCKNLYIGIKEGSILDTGLPYANDLPVIFYGSSITQGGCSSRPGTCYQAILSERHNMDYINLGFSGNGRAEEAIVNYMADLPMKIFVSDYDYNATDADYLETTLRRMYRTVRAKHPTVPFVFVSAPKAALNEEFYDRWERICKIYREALAAGDKAVYFVDGSHLFDGDAADNCTVDGTHPTDLGFFRMAAGIDAVLAPLL